MVLATHGAWVVQRYCRPMGHGLCNGIAAPWVMGCTMIWIPMGHGLCNTIEFPWVMGCIIAYHEDTAYIISCTIFYVVYIPDPLQNAQ